MLAPQPPSRLLVPVRPPTPTQACARMGIRSIAIVLLGFLLLVPALALGSADPGTGPRTSGSGNEPSAGFSEGATVVRISHDDGSSDTEFALNETVHVQVRSSVLDGVGTGDDNRLRMVNSTGLVIYQQLDAFSLVSSVPEFVYNTSFVASLGNGFTTDHYKLELRLQEGPAPSDQRLLFADTLVIGGGAVVAKEFTTYADPDYSVPSTTFGPTDIVYVEAFAGGAAAAANSSVTFSNFFGDTQTLGIDQLGVPALNTSGALVRFAFDLGSDLDHDVVSPIDGWWYGLEVDLFTSNDTPLTRHWSGQVRLSLPPSQPPVVALGSTFANPPTVVRDGTSSTQLRVPFSDEDSPSVDSFGITLRVRDSAGGIVTLVAAARDGHQGVSISDLGNGSYAATYPWVPAEGTPLGTYDLEAVIDDFTSGGIATDTFGNNPDEVEVLAAPNLPTLTPGTTSATPAILQVDGPSTTQLGAAFAHADDLAVSVFAITFAVRDEANNVLTLVQDEHHGNSGLTVTRIAVGSYLASLSWNPPDNATVGAYDLQMSIRDTANGTAVDSFSSNSNELVLSRAPQGPQVASGATGASPTNASMGIDQILLWVNFTHPESPGLESFSVSFEVRDGNETVLQVLDDGDLGAPNLTLHSTGGTAYSAQFRWAVPTGLVAGTYDLQASITDHHGLVAVDLFSNNLEELDLITPPVAPTLTAGTTIANPRYVNVLTDAITNLSLDFQLAEAATADSFLVTIKVRDQGNNVLTLVDSQSHGNHGLVVEQVDEGQWKAHFLWNPPAGQGLGTYDLSATVRMAQSGLSISDAFTANLEELTLADEDLPLPNETGTLQGTITDGAGVPVSGALLVVLDGAGKTVATTVVGPSGTYSLTLQKGAYRVVASKEGRIGDSADSVVVEKGQSTTLDLQLPLAIAPPPPKTVTTLPLGVIGMMAVLILLVVLLAFLLLRHHWPLSDVHEGDSERPGTHRHDVERHPARVRSDLASPAEAEPEAIPAKRVRVAGRGKGDSDK